MNLAIPLFFYPFCKAFIDFAKNYDIIIVLLKVDEEEIIRRNVARRLCKNCQKIYNIYLFPPKEENKCDECGSELYQREDDKEEVIRERFRIYQNEIKEIIDYMKTKSNIFEVDGNGKVEEIYQIIKEII